MARSAISALRITTAILLIRIATWPRISREKPCLREIPFSKHSLQDQWDFQDAKPTEDSQLNRNNAVTSFSLQAWRIASGESPSLWSCGSSFVVSAFSRLAYERQQSAHSASPS